MPVLCCWRVWYLGLVPSIAAHPVIVRPGPAQLQQELVQPHHTGFGLSSHQRGGLDVSLSPSSAAQLRSSVVRGRKWVQLPGTSATSPPPARAQPGVTDGRWSRHSLLLVVLWFSIFFPVKKKPQKKKISKNHPGRWRAGLAATCVLWLGAACTRVAPLLQTKTHHKTQEFKSL